MCQFCEWSSPSLPSSNHCALSLGVNFSIRAFHRYWAYLLISDDQRFQIIVCLDHGQYILCSANPDRAFRGGNKNKKDLLAYPYWENNNNFYIFCLLYWKIPTKTQMTVYFLVGDKFVLSEDSFNKNYTEGFLVFNMSLYMSLFYKDLLYSIFGFFVKYITCPSPWNTSIMS